jgi:CTP:molybdopterin cytidylyltransferase MocA
VDKARVIVPIVLAAGASTRMGAPKASLLLGGRPALAWVLEACRDLAPAIVVAGAHPDAVRSVAGNARVVVNETWARGRLTSIRAGLDALPRSAEAFLLWPVDVPLAGAAVPLLLDAFENRKKERAWVPSHGMKRGHPLLLAKDVAEEIRALGDDDSLRAVVRSLDERKLLVHVECDDPAILEDMDTPEDRARLESLLRARSAGSGHP